MRKQYDLGFGHMGNGVTVWNRLRLSGNGDYETVAHINTEREVKIYDEDMPQEIRDKIQWVADTSEMRISSTQNLSVFKTPPRKKKYVGLYSKTCEKICYAWGTNLDDASAELYKQFNAEKDDSHEECVQSSMTILMPFYFTFGSDECYPYQNGYVVVYAQNLSESCRIFRNHFPDLHQNCINCSFVYTEEEWEKTEMRNQKSYPCYETIYASKGMDVASGNIPREFIVNTPLGKLKVYAKHQTDSPKDYPGVFIDFIDKEGELITLACTEFDSYNNRIQTCVYGNGNDDSPTNVIHHRNLQQSE